MNNTNSFNLTKNQATLIKQVSVENADVNVNNNSFTLQVKKDVHLALLEVEVEFVKSQVFNYFELPIQGLSDGKSARINIFYSEDGIIWKKAPLRDNYISENSYQLESALIQACFVQLVFYGADLGKLAGLEIKNAKIEKTAKIQSKSSSQLDRLWVVENITDHRDDYGWASEKRGHNKNDTISINLGNEFFLNSLFLRSTNETPNCFPVGFSIYLSLDGTSWESVANESEFIVRKFSWYSWTFSPKRAKYIQIQIDKHFPLNENEFLSKILEIEINAVPENKIQIQDFTDQGQIDHASELVPGLVVLAENNTSAPNKAVQSNDARLRKATTEYLGITKLAKDGEARAEVVIQGNDSRLKNASEIQPGIVQLAKDREVRTLAAVQSSDSRLKNANDKNSGIVILAKDGDNRPNVVVQGNDSRLRSASTEHAGIVQLAKNGEEVSEKAVQSNDKRLRNGTTSWPGIVQFAGHNENIGNRALQSDDPRLELATEQKNGRVMLAKDGENSQGKVVQGNDSRLNYANENNHGLVKIAGHGKKIFDAVVRSDDPRLFDKRDPHDHEHSYAAKNHDFNDHKGSLNIHFSQENNTNHIKQPPLNQCKFSVSNDKGTAAFFKGGVWVESSQQEPAMKLHSKNSSPLEITSENGEATFLSQKGFAIKIPSKVGEATSSGKSIDAQGEVRFSGEMNFTSGYTMTLSAADFSDEAFSNGDLLTVQNGKIQKVKSNNQNIIGVYYSGISINLGLKNSGKNHKIALSGKIKVKIKGAVKSGDLVVFGNANPGVAKASNKNAEIKGKTLISFETNDKNDEKMVWCII